MGRVHIDVVIRVFLGIIMRGLLLALPFAPVVTGASAAPCQQAPVTVSFPANPFWSDSGVALRAGQTVTITASGQWSVYPSGICGPDGIPGSTGNPDGDEWVASANKGALIGFIGSDPYSGGGWFGVGSSYRFTAPVSGELWFGINDDYVSGGAYDNGGSLTATISCSRCPVADLPPYGPPDPYPLDTANLTGPTQSAVGCLRSCTGIVDAPALLASGYRPEAYQNHLAEVWKKWEALKDEPNPACAELKAKVRNEFFTIHELNGSTVTIPPGPNCHSDGTCFDVKRAQIPAVDRCSSFCKVVRPLGPRDPGHTVPY